MREFWGSKSIEDLEDQKLVTDWLGLWPDCGRRGMILRGLGLLSGGGGLGSLRASTLKKKVCRVFCSWVIPTLLDAANKAPVTVRYQVRTAGTSAKRLLRTLRSV